MKDPIHTVCAACGAVNRLRPEKLADSGSAKCGGCHAPLLPDTPPAVSEAHFDAFINRGDIPVLVDFWAPWCGPCRTLGPILERAARQLSPDVRVAKVNIDEAQGLAQRLRVQAVPTLAIYRKGREVARTSGVMSETQLANWARQAIA